MKKMQSQEFKIPEIFFFLIFLYPENEEKRRRTMKIGRIGYFLLEFFGFYEQSKESGLTALIITWRLKVETYTIHKRN